MPVTHVLRAASLAIAVTLAFGTAAEAKTLRFSSQGDITTIDPHANNEGFTNAFLDNIYEPLVTRGKDLKIEPCLALAFLTASISVTEFMEKMVRIAETGKFD